MEINRKKQLSVVLKQALMEEHLWSKDAAGYLNLNPTYISMMLNPKLFDKASNSAWERLEEWHNTKEKISNFKIPSIEPIWKPAEKSEQSKKPEKANKEKANSVPLKSKNLRKIKVPDNIEPLKESYQSEHIAETARVKIALDIDINLVVNGTRVKIG